MELRDQLLKEHSRNNIQKVKRWVGNDAERFAAVMHLFFTDETKVVQRAAWVMSEAGIEHPELLKPWLKKLADQLAKPGQHDAVRRNITRIFQFIPIPKKLQGRVVDTCILILRDPDEKIAAKAFSMTVLVNIVKENPDLKNEVALIIEDQIPYGSPGIRSRGKKMLAVLKKIA